MDRRTIGRDPSHQSRIEPLDAVISRIDDASPVRTGFDAAGWSSALQVGNRRGGLSRFEYMAAGTALVSMPRQAMLAVLLDAILKPAGCGWPVLRPLWVDEAVQRAYNMVRLISELDRQVPCSRGDPLGAATEYRVAMELAEAFRSLAVADDEELLPCSEALRTIVRNLVELFGPVVGQIQVRTSVERLALPAFKRRAVVLVPLHRGYDSLAASG